MHTLTHCPPWLREDGAALMQRSRSARLPHALLLTGIQGIGKHHFAQWLAEALLCRQSTETGACGQCEACSQLMAGSHPDYRKLAPEGANAAIKIDPVRALVDWLQLTAGQSSYRVALLDQADTLNRSAANALLKTLEEPADHSVLVLSATRSGALPATVRSRCQQITLRLTDRKAAVDWLAGQAVDNPELALKEAGGGPYRAMASTGEERLAARSLLIKAWRDLFLRKGSVGRISESLSDMDTSECLTAFMSWTLAAVRQGHNLELGVNPAVEQAISETRERLSNEQWFTFHDRLLQLHRSDSASFKTQAVLEGLFADIRIMTNGGPSSYDRRNT